MAVDDLYGELILDHYRNPRHKGPCEPGDLSLTRNNPLCGDEITLSISIQQRRIERISFSGQGCAISLASASMMCEAMQTLSTEEALDRVQAFVDLLGGKTSNRDLGDLLAFEGVAQFPVRIKCALLPWMTLKELLLQAAPNQKENELRSGR
jgi:nitrogen fixation protein NifU and related proteins